MRADGTYSKPIGYNVTSFMTNVGSQYMENGQHRDVYRPSKPNFVWQQDDQLTGQQNTFPYAQKGYVKDGTHGAWGVPEHAIWYDKNVTFPASEQGQ